MRLEGSQARPFLDHDEGVLAEPGLHVASTLGIDGRDVLDAPLLGMQFGTLAWNAWSSSARRPGFAVMTAMR
jgi:hypothetical protein